MNDSQWINKIIIGLWLTFAMAFVHAGKPLWMFTPLTKTRITVTAQDTAIVSYQVTNQARRPYTLVMKTIPGVTQIVTAGHCPNPFVLSDQQSCILSLYINGSLLHESIEGGPEVCNQGSSLKCYQPANANILRITKKTTLNFTVGGSVNGLSGTLVLENNGDALTLSADGTFNFSSALSPGNAYSVNVQSQPANQTCTVINGSGIITNVNVSNVTVNCSTNTRTVGGNISGLAISESVVLQNNGSDILTVNNNGSFTFLTPVAQGANHNVTIHTHPASQTCTVNNGSGTVGISNITNVQVTCSTNALTVGGIVSGLSGTVVLQDTGGDTLTINGDGSFTFPTLVAEDASYSVTVLTQPTLQTCIVSNGTGTMGGADVTNVVVICATNTATLIPSIDNLALSVTGITEYGISGTPSSGLPRIITIANNSTNPAVNLAVIPPGWPAGTTSTTTCGSTLPANSSCTITITPGATATSDGTNPCSSGTAPVVGTVQVSADNSTTASINVVVLSYLCIYQGGYVYAFDDTTVNTASVGGKVATTSNQITPNGIIWSSNGGAGSVNVSDDIIPGINETSTSVTGTPTYATFASFFLSTYNNANPFTSASFSMCNGNSDGSCNTGNIVTFYNEFITNNTGGTPPFTASAEPTNTTLYAAGLCKQTIASFSDWYLPAICELGYGSGCGTSGTPSLQNLQSSLIDIGGLGTLSGLNWSSTESAANPQTEASYQLFAPSSPSGQGNLGKGVPLGVRCSRAFTS